MTKEEKMEALAQMARVTAEYTGLPLGECIQGTDLAASALEEISAALARKMELLDKSAGCIAFNMAISYMLKEKGEQVVQHTKTILPLVQALYQQEAGGDER